MQTLFDASSATEHEALGGQMPGSPGQKDRRLKDFPPLCWQDTSAGILRVLVRRSGTSRSWGLARLLIRLMLGGGRRTDKYQLGRLDRHQFLVRGMDRSIL